MLNVEVDSFLIETSKKKNLQIPAQIYAAELLELTENLMYKYYKVKYKDLEKKDIEYVADEIYNFIEKYKMWGKNDK